MSNLRALKQKLSTVSRLWKDKDYDAAMAEVECLLRQWPGNSRLHILWANLVQLQEESPHTLDEAKQALQRAIELDLKSPAAAIELGCFLDNVEDNPQAASKAYAQGVGLARQLLVDGLIGQAQVFRQLNKTEEWLACILEVFHLTGLETGPKKTSPDDPRFAQFKEQLQDLLSKLAMNGSAHE